MTLVLGLVGYGLAILFATLIDYRLGVGAAAAVCLYLSYANTPRKGPQ